MNLWIGIGLLLAADFFIIFNLLSKADDAKKKHLLKLKESEAMRLTALRKNSKLVEKNQIASGFELAYRSRLKEINQGIVDLQLFLTIISSKTNL